MRRALLVTIAAFLLGAAPAGAQSVQLVPFGGQTYASPFHVAGEPGDPSRVYVAEEGGRIHLVVNGTTQSPAFLDISTDVFDRGEGGCECGLFSMAFAPDYATSGRFYVFYTRNTAAQHDLVIREFRRTSNPNDIDESTGRDVVVINHPVGSDNHNGGQLQFGPDGLLYIATGDGGGTPQNAQSLTTTLGKILRINPVGAAAGQYTIPGSNPFVDGPGGTADEIYSYGLRNPYRFSFDRLTGDMIIGDVGQTQWEEIDFVPNGGGLGANFGWRCFEGPDEFTMAGECSTPLSNHTPPVLAYDRTGSSAAVNGGYVVRDTALPSLLGRYLYADTLAALGNQIRSAVLVPGGSSGDAPTGLTASFVVSFGEDACGHVYVAHGNTVSRIEPTSGAFPCAPQLAPVPVPAPPAGDLRGPALTTDLGKRRNAARGGIVVTVTCDEACTVRLAGKVLKRGKDIGLGSDSATLAAGVRGSLRLALSKRNARRLLTWLRQGLKAKAALVLTATDGAGNTSTDRLRFRQKP